MQQRFSPIWLWLTWVALTVIYFSAGPGAGKDVVAVAAVIFLGFAIFDTIRSLAAKV